MKPAEGLRSLRAIARELGVPERILAADTARFAAAIPYRMIEGKRRYGPGAAAALRLNCGDREAWSVLAPAEREHLAVGVTDTRSALVVPVVAEAE